MKPSRLEVTTVTDDICNKGAWDMLKQKRVTRSFNLATFDSIRSYKKKKDPLFRGIRKFYTFVTPNDCNNTCGLIVPLAIVFLLLRSFTTISAGANIAPSTLKKSKPAALNVS